MVDFIHLLAPHYQKRDIRDAANLPNQQEVDATLGGIILPVRGGCEEPVGSAAATN